MGLIPHEVERVAGSDLVPGPCDIEDERALEGEDQFLPGVEEWFVATVRAGIDRGECCGAAERRVRTRNAGEGQARVWGEQGGPVRRRRECDGLGLTLVLV